MPSFEQEIDRARRAYALRDADAGVAARYDALGPVNLFRLQERDWVVASLLRSQGLATLAGLDILEVGCGSGASLQRLVGLGADPRRLWGIDLVPDRAQVAVERLPGAAISVGSAHQLPYSDGAFDLVTQMMLFSSVVDGALRSAIAAEMRRTLRPGGLIVSYDAHGGPTTPDFVPIPVPELERLFPGWHVTQRPVTLRWSLIQRIAPRSRLLAELAVRLPGLRSHTVAVIRAPA